jgi:hypothetical protein
MSSSRRDHARSPRELEALIGLQRKGVAFLVYQDATGAQVLHELPDQAGSVSVGRAPDADVALIWDQEASRLHAELEPVGKGWTVVDDGLSTNGTFVNGRRISGRRRLADHDVVRVGTTSLTFRHPAQLRDNTTVKAGGLPSVDELTPTQRKVLVGLCRPYKESDFATPATNQQIAEEIFLSVDAVKHHLRLLSQRFGLDGLKQNRKRAALAEMALQWGLVTRSEL